MTVTVSRARNGAAAEDESGGSSLMNRRKDSSVSLWARVLRRPLGIVCVAYLVLVALAAIAAPSIAPYDPNGIDLDNVMSGPSLEHWLGTDSLGRDVLSRLLFGGQISLVNAAVASATFVVVGAMSGLLAGMVGGWADRVFTWLVDIVIAIPALIVLLVILTIFGSNMTVAMLALGVLSSPGFARVIRGMALAIREELSIAAVRASGIPTGFIIINHMLPRVRGPILVHTSLFCGSALIIEAGLAYLGFGVQPPTATWGGMIAEASSVIQQHTWLLFPPGITLVLATVALAVLGDVVRDVAAERAGRSAGSRPEASRGRDRGVSAGRDLVRQAENSRCGLLSVRDLSATVTNEHGEVAVVQGVDLEIWPGETVGLVGESGCGKSITGRLVLGTLPPGSRVTNGQVAFDGVPLVKAKDYRRLRGQEIGMISQEPLASLDPMFTVGQQIGELVKRHSHGISRSEAGDRIIQLLKDVALPEPEVVAGRYPHELSGGMAQRVAIAMALAGEPRLLVADEPTTALDVTIQAEILELLDYLRAKRNMAVLLISHDWGVVAETCDRAYVMYAGEVVESAPVEAMIRRPNHPYTEGLLRSIPAKAKPMTPLSATRGTVPSPGEWPQGCHFSNRCDYAVARCKSSPVEMVEIVEGRYSRCIRASDLYEV